MANNVSIEDLKKNIEATEKDFDDFLNKKLSDDFGISDPNKNMSINDKMRYILENEHEIVLDKTASEMQKEYNKELDELKRLAEIAEKMIQEKEENLEKLNEQINGLNSKKEEKEKEKESLEEEISVLDIEINLLLKKQKELDDESKKIEEEKALKDSEIKKIETEISEINDKIKELESKQERSDEENQELENLKKKLEEKENSKKSLKDELNNLEEKKKINSDNKKTNDDKLKSLKDEKSKKSDDLHIVNARIKYYDDKLNEFSKKRDEETKSLAEQKAELTDIFAKRNIPLNFSSEPTKDEKKVETPESEKKANGKSVGGGVYPPQPRTNLPTLSNEQAVKNMYANLKGLDPNARIEVLSKMGRADINAMLKHLTWHPLKRAELKRLVEATKLDMLKDPIKREKIMKTMEKPFGIKDANYFIINDFSVFEQKDLDELRAKIDDFNKNKNTYSREEQIMFDEYAKMVSLNSLEYQIKKAGPIGKVKDFFVKDQTREDINKLFDTMSMSRSEFGKDTKMSEFYQSIVGQTNSPIDISRKSEISVTKDDHISSRISANIKNNGQVR